MYLAVLLLINNSQAVTVHVWLGPYTKEGEIAMKWIAKRLGGKEKPTMNQPFWSRTQGKAVLDLFQKPYWRRVWIVQEIMLANDIVVCHGH